MDPKPPIAGAAMDTILDHVATEPNQEVGGILIGTIADGGAEITAALPALKAVGHRANVTFTHDVWDEILPVVDRDHPGSRIVGWYHSHPGFGIFLSDYDRFIHQNFFSDPAMLALVVDPHTGHRGWFGWADGSISRLDATGDPSVRQPDDAATGAPPPALAGSRPRVNRGTTILIAATAVALAFGGGWAVGSDTDPAAPAEAESADANQRLDDLRTELAAAEDAAAEATSQRAQAQTDADAATEELAELRTAQSDNDTSDTDDADTIPYRVRAGDTLWALAHSFFGNGHHYDALMTANPDLDPHELTVGQTVTIPTTRPDAESTP